MNIENKKFSLKNFKGAAVTEKNSELERKVDVLENNFQIGIEQQNDSKKKLKDVITMHD